MAHSYDPDRPIPSRPLTESEVLAESQRGKAAFDVSYPEEGKRDTFMPYVSRYRGQEPDFYDAFAAGVYLEVIRSERERMKAFYQHVPTNGQAVFNWDNVMGHSLLDALEEHTVSMGGGKGRKEAVELGKAGQLVAQKSRWTLRRRE